MFPGLGTNNALLIHITPYMDGKDHSCYNGPTSKRTSSTPELRPIEDAVPEEHGPKNLRCPVDECVESTRANVEKCGVIIILL